MKKTKQIFINCIVIATLLLATSCEKELYDEAIKTNTSTGKSKPNIKVSSLNFTRNHPTIQKISQKTKSKLKTSRTNNIETNTLEAYFGEVKLDYGVEIIDSLNRKTTTFEVKETTVNPNEYYNFVIQNDSEFWLYKIEKIESTYKNYPANSTIVSRYSINDNLTMSSPCDTIVFPPFGEMISEVIPSGTGGGSVSIGNINNPTEGGGFGFGLGVGYGSGYFNGLGPGSGGSGGGPSSGGNGASGQSLALIQIEDFLSDAWNWIRNLFSGGCNCGNRTSNRGAEEDLIVNSGGVVLEIKDSTVDCGEGGYVFITPQDEYVDKILEFENYFTYLHNNDRVFLYNNHHIVDYLYTLIQQNSNNANLMTILPELINKTRKGEITWEFATQLINNTIESGLIFDVEKSYKSPANIDFTAIDKTTPEGQKLDCIYQKLMQSPSFKNLFEDTFGGSQTKLNVKFEIADNLPNNINGTCQLQPPSNGNYTNLIRINVNILSGPDIKSNFKVAKTILHECIHAYLNIKKINCNLGTTIPELNGLDLQSLIGTFYQSFGCHIDVNGSPQSQHEFMFTYLIPTFQSIIGDIYQSLASESNLNYVNSTPFYNSLTDENFNWSWNDFFKYYSLEGLHQCDSFINAIQNVPNENYKYNFYRTKAQEFTKNCQ